ncbi:MAG: hypothetical protein KC877_02200 [Candidatus Kaiserbacteria bacterium]|nr:hypothetical protein [Candidatus Kaiserbacteria bacterium]MCB9816176.1 hypothetical protein [Candidatus Nomurabacteria bacterium]
MAYIIGIIVVVLIAVGFAMTKSSDTPTTITTEPETSLPVAETPAVTDTESADTMTTVIADGVHTTAVTYLTPANNEYLLDVSLTTENGVITDANIVYSQGAEKDPNAQRFEGAYKEEIIGKKIDELDLSRVGGASLTTGAFNGAVDNILAENA